jgi:hypothetical protein
LLAIKHAIEEADGPVVIKHGTRSSMAVAMPDELLEQTKDVQPFKGYLEKSEL